MDLTYIARNLADVRARIHKAAQDAGRDAADVRLLAVSKTFGLDHVRAAAAAGQEDFGENRVQEALQKIEGSADLKIRWHLIGTLQSNKVRKAVPRFSAIHSVDSRRLLDAIDAAATDGRDRTGTAGPGRPRGGDDQAWSAPGRGDGHRQGRSALPGGTLRRADDDSALLRTTRRMRGRTSPSSGTFAQHC